MTMLKVIKIVSWMFWITLVINMLYLRGYLLTKIEIDQDSQCSQLSSSGNGCWSKPVFKKAVLVLVDALRHDFTVYNDSIPENKRKPWQNRMPIFSELRNRYPNNTKHFKFIADPPSATFLRLKGLTTGGLPTFVDLGSNFGATEITEDSWVKQLALNKKKLVFMGDDTWMGIYGRYFHRAFPFPSFDVWDLHTVDNGVWNHLIPEIGKDDWDVIVAHFLGVDHAGHRYDVNNPELASKLEQVNGWIGEIIPHIDNETVLFIFGDHGMTTSGDHGGETYDEITSTLFVYSGSSFYQESKSTILHQSRVYQTDIVPTLTLLLGVPIPYSSIGKIIPSIFMVDNYERHVLLQNVFSNLKQVFRYVEAYSILTNEFNEKEISSFRNSVQIVGQKIAQSKEFSEELFHEAFLILQNIREICVHRWARFDLVTMAEAITLSSFAFILFIILFVDNIIDIKWYNLTPVFIAIGVAFDQSSLWAGFSHRFTICSVIITFLMNFYCIYSTVVKNYREMLLALINTKHHPSYIFSLLIVVSISVGFTTNSYILVEDFTAIFFLGTLIITMTLENTARLKSNRNKLKEVFIAFVAGSSSRLTSVYFGCREEQFWCQKSWWLESKIDDGVHQNRLYVLGVLAMVLNIVILYFRRKHAGSMAVLKKGANVKDFLLAPIQVMLVVSYWALSSTQSNVLSEHALCWLPRTVYLISILSVGLTVYHPSMVRIIRGEKTTPVAFGLQGALTSPFLSIYSAVVPTFALLLGMNLSPVLLVITVEILSLSHLLRYKNILVRIVTLDILMLQLFYATGHQAAVQQIDWNAAFVGFIRHSNNIIPGFIIGLRTLMGVVITAILSPLLLLSSPLSSKTVHEVNVSEGQGQDVGDMRYIMSPQLFTSYVNNVVAVTGAVLMFKTTWGFVACYVHRRHLMIWNIFTPRVILELAVVSVFLFSLVLILTLLSRIHNVVGSELSKKLKH